MSKEYCIGIDPAYAKPNAFAVIDVVEEIVIAHGTFNVLGELGLILQTYVISAVFIEDQYIGKNKKVALELAHASGEIIGFCKALGECHCEYINPAWMRSYVRISGKYRPSKKWFMERIIPKTVDMWDLQSIKGKQRLEDICCAINIGLHGARRLKSGRIIKR